MEFDFLLKKNIDLAIIFLLVLVFGFAGIIYVNRTVGTDTPTYIEIFESCLFTERAFWGIEPGFWALNRLVRSITPNYKVLFFLMYLISALSVCRALYSLKTEISLSFSVICYFALFYLQALSLARMYLASSIVLLSTVELYQGKKIRSFITLLLASSIHYSCLMMYIPWFFCFTKLDKKLYIVSLLTVGIFFTSGMMEYVIGLFPRYELYLDFIGEKSVVGVMFYVRALPLLILLLQSKSFFTEESFSFFFIYVFFLIFIFFISYFFIPIGRMWVHLEFVYLVFVSASLRYLKDTGVYRYGKLERILFLFLIIFMCCLYIYEYHISDKLFINTI